MNWKLWLILGIALSLVGGVLSLVGGITGGILDIIAIPMMIIGGLMFNLTVLGILLFAKFKK